MKITQVNRIRRQLYRLSFEDAADAEIDVRTFDESPYRVGSELTELQWEALCALSMQNRLRERALYLLSGRSYSGKELERKLARPHSGPAVQAEQAAQTVQRMEQLGLVDDVSYAERLARDLQRYRQYPLRRIAAELAAKGIDRDIITEALDGLELTDGEVALTLVQKKYSRKLSTEQDRKKTADALLRRGFSYQDVRQAMQQSGNSLQGPDEEWL